MIKATVVADVPSPHQNVFFDAVAQLGEVDLEVLFCRRTMGGRAWSGEAPRVARHRFLRKAAVRGMPTNPLLVPELLATPERVVLLIGYYLPALLSAGLWLGALKRPWIFWTDTLPEATAADPFYRRAARRWFLDRSTACLSTGEAGRKALLAHGVPSERAFGLPFVVDQEKFHNAPRTGLPLPKGARVFLFAGQLIRRKGIDVLLDALALLERQGPAPHLAIIGDGADAAEFRAQAQRLQLGDDKVSFIHYLDHGQLPRWFAAADAFVLPSRWDPWPVVVIEALAAGLPVIATEACGSARDLVTPACGFLCAPADVLSLAEALRAAMSADLRSMREAARAAVAPLEPRRVARQFTGVLEAVQRLRSP